MMVPVNNTVEHYKKARLPPAASAGVIGWLRQNLFSSVSNTILTLVSVYLLSLAIPAILDWAFLSSQVSGDTRFDCKVEGACWAWLDQRFGQFLFGFYPEGELGYPEYPGCDRPLFRVRLFLKKNWTFGSQIRCRIWRFFEKY